MSSIKVTHRLRDDKQSHPCPACGNQRGIPTYGLLTRSKVINRRLSITVRGLCWHCGTISDLPHLTVKDVFND